MRQKDFGIGCLRNRRKKLRRRLHIAILVDEPVITHAATRRLKRVKVDIGRLQVRKRAVRAVYFNLNIFSTQESLKLFRFRASEIPTVADVIPWRGHTLRRRYACN